MKCLFWAALVLAVVPGCGSEKVNDRQDSILTRQEKDSVLAESSIPGAGAVGRAITVSDSAAVRVKKIDSEER